MSFFSKTGLINPAHEKNNATQHKSAKLQISMFWLQQYISLIPHYSFRAIQDGAIFADVYGYNEAELYIYVKTRVKTIQRHPD